MLYDLIRKEKEKLRKKFIISHGNRLSIGQYLELKIALDAKVLELKQSAIFQ